MTFGLTVTTDEAAEIAGVSTSQVHRWVILGWLEPVRRGAKPLRFRYDEVARCQREHRPGTWQRRHETARRRWRGLTDAS